MYCDYDAPAFYLQKEVRARKVHKCCECHGLIQKGEVHESVSGKWEDEVGRFRTCLDCVHIRCDLANLDGGCGGYLHEGLRIAIEDLNPIDRPRFIGMWNATPREGKRRMESDDECI